MLAAFSLRLALGMVATLLVLTPTQVNPRFFRAHFQIALGIALAGLLFAHLATLQSVGLTACLVAGLVFATLGSVVYAFEGAPGGRTLTVLTSAAFAAGLVLLGPAVETAAVEAGRAVWVHADSFTSAAFLGATMTAMLMGHSYLNAPTMSIAPLVRLLAVLGVATTARAAVAGLGLWCWTESQPSVSLTGAMLLWLPVRWGVGLVGPAVLAVLAWQTARIRSTQSATGILYVVVILGFLGELTSMLLFRDAGYPM
jgi:hypothetical protein